FQRKQILVCAAMHTGSFSDWTMGSPVRLRLSVLSPTNLMLCTPDPHPRNHPQAPYATCVNPRPISYHFLYLCYAIPLFHSLDMPLHARLSPIKEASHRCKTGVSRSLSLVVVTSMSLQVPMPSDPAPFSAKPSFSPSRN